MKIWVEFWDNVVVEEFPSDSNVAALNHDLIIPVYSTSSACTVGSKLNKSKAVNKRSCNTVLRQAEHYLPIISCIFYPMSYHFYLILCMKIILNGPEENFG